MNRLPGQSAGCAAPAKFPLLIAVFLCMVHRDGRSQSKPDVELTKLADGVYAHMANSGNNAVSNAGVVVFEHGTLVFDTHLTAEAGQSLLARIQSVTSKPVRYLVNSHFHPDHTHGNQAFSRVHQVIASTNARRETLQKDMPAFNRMISVAKSQLEKIQADLAKEQDDSRKAALRKMISTRQEFLDRMSRETFVPPVVTFDDTLVIRDGVREVRLLYLGAGHTEGDAILFLPSEKIVFLGDLFFNASFPNAQDANLLDWIKTLSEALELDAEKFVPGHGSLGDRRDVRNFLGYLQDLKSTVEPAVLRGDALDQVIRDTQVPAKYAAFGSPEFFPSNVQKMYAELKSLHRATLEATPPEPAKKPNSERPLP